MTKLTCRIKKIRPSAIFLLGDIFGYDDTVLNHSDFYAEVLKFFALMKNITKNNVYVVKGNHDYGDRTEFSLLMKAEYYKNPNFVDFKNEDGILTTRFHFLNYGEEHDTIPLKKSKSHTISNIVLGHNDYAIEGITDWYKSDHPLYIKELHNLRGVELIISGHIHQGSDFLDANIDGEDLSLIYPGAPSRASSHDDHDGCDLLTITHEGHQISPTVNGEGLELLPCSEIFIEEEEDTSKETKQEMEERIRQESIDKIIEELGSRRTTQMDVLEQIKVLPYFSDEAKNKAEKVYRDAKNDL